MNKFYLVFATFFAPITCMAQCLTPLDKNLMTQATIDGKEVYVVSKDYVDQSECLDLEFINSEMQRLEKLEETLAEYQSVSDNLVNNIQGYRDVNNQLNLTLDRSIALTDRYDQQVAEYDRLSGEFDQLAGRYDELAEEYRNIALGRSSFISFDAGVGIDENDEFMGLLGVGTKNIKVWGLLQDNNNGLIIGGTIPF